MPIEERRGKLVYILTLAFSANKFLRGQASYMRNRGWDVHVITGPGTDASELSEREHVKVHTLPIARNPSPARDIRTLVAIYRKIRAIDPDVVVSSTPKAGLLGTLAAFAARVPGRVYLVRGLRYEGAGQPLRTALKLFESAALATSTGSIAISHSLRDKIVADRLTFKVPQVLGAGSGNGVPVLDIQKGVTAFRSADTRADMLGQFADRLVVLFVGRHVPDKGVHHALAALAMVPNVVFLSVGPDTESLGWIDRSVAEAVDWICHPTVDDVSPYFAAADVLVLPTMREGMGNVLLEAQAAGLPVVAYDVTGAKDALVDGVTGYLVPYADINALAATVIRLQNDKSLRTALGVAGAQWVSDTFDQNTLWAKYSDFFFRESRRAKKRLFSRRRGAASASR